jgi:hypothetical protein
MQSATQFSRWKETGKREANDGNPTSKFETQLEFDVPWPVPKEAGP